MQTPNQITYRQAVEQDVSELARLRWEFLAKEASDSGQSLEEFTVQMAEFWVSSVQCGRWTIWVAAVERSLVGCMWVQHIEKVPHPGKTRIEYGYVTNVYVEGGWRNAGVGSELMRRLTDWARQLPMEFLIVWPSRESVSFYEKAGFRASPDALELHW